MEERKISDVITAPVRDIHGPMFQEIFKLLLNKVLFVPNTPEGKLQPPYTFVSPETLLQKIDFKLGMEGTDMATLFKFFDQVIKYNPKYSHPYKMNGRGSGADPMGIAGDLIATTMNSVVLTYMYAPCFTLMEHVVFQKLREMAGYGKDGDGTLNADSNLADAMAISVALQAKFKLVRHHGHIKYTEKPVFFYPIHTDYLKIANFLRLDEKCGVAVKLDRNGRMDVKDLRVKIEKAIENGKTPFLVIGVAGSPNLGTIDPLEKISDVCHEFKLWFHVNASIGGPCLTSEKQKWRLDGIESSDSFTWSADFIFATPFSSAFLLCKKQGILSKSFALDSPIVFSDTDLYDIKWNTGDRTIHTSRRPDILKMWYMWKAKGTLGLGAHVDYIYANSAYFVQEIKKRDAFRLLLPSADTPYIGFYFLPMDIRGKPNIIQQFGERLSKVTEEIADHFLTEGIIHIGTRAMTGFPRYLFISLNNSVLTKRDIKYVLDQIEYAGMGIPSQRGDLTPEFTDTEDDSILEMSGSYRESGPPMPPPVPKEFPPFVSAPIETLHKKFFQDLFQLFQKLGLYFQDGKIPPLEFHTPEQLLKLMDFSLGDEGRSNDEMIAITKQIILYSSHQSHPRYVYQLKAGLDPYGVMADYFQIAMTSSCVTYMEAPTYTLMENEIVRAVREILGYPMEAGSFDDGLIVPGGSLCNIYALRVALFKYEGKNWSENKRFVLFISDCAHYCPEKGGILEGLGENNCILIKTNAKHQMIPEELVKNVEKVIAEGGLPFLVVATLATTVMGGIDPIGEIADICEKYKMFLHVDGSFGGPIIFSEKIMNSKKGLREALKRTDSFCFNSHKMLAIPCTASVLVIKEHGLLRNTFMSDNDLEETKLYDQNKWDNSRKRLQKEARADVFKFYIAWKAKGIQGFAKHLEMTFENTKFAVKEMKKRKGSFELLLPEFECVSVCFYYIPLKMRGLSKDSTGFRNRISKVGKILQKRIITANLFLFVLEEDKLNPTYIKINFISSGTTRANIIELIDIIDKEGKDIQG